MVSIRRVVLLSPILFMLHVIEEAPGFVAWFNSLVERGITQSTFLSVNAVGFLITVVLAAALALTRERTAGLLVLAWLGFLMLANALFHLVATVVHERYSPGVITGTILYLPYFIWFFQLCVRQLGIRAHLALGATIIGAIPMAVHGFLIVFRGDRLF